MRNFSDGSSDLTVAFDAFKITKHTHLTEWRVKTLTPWAIEMLCRTEVTKMVLDHDGWPIERSGDGFINADAQPFKCGAGFPRRTDALSFLRELEKSAWRFVS
jgi:hypothetical protein